MTIKKVSLIAVFAITILCLGIVALAQPMAMPHVIFGTVTDEAGAIVPAADVTITNSRTGESLAGKTNGNGQYQIDLANMPGGYLPGDEITIKAELNDLSGSKEITVSGGPNDLCDLIIKEKTGIPFPMFGSMIIIMTSIALIAGYYRRNNY